MIRVEKTAAAKPVALDKVGKDGKTERERAEAFYADPANHAQSFKFQAYGEEPVRAALNALFHFKCAYCENSYDASQPVAVEHFRPKGEVTTDAGSQRPGYYWLAADWDNLFPSCTDCNSERYHPLEDGTKIKYGKANLFPLSGARAVPLVPGVEKHEQPLLLDPYLDQPERHLEFGDEGVVRPVLDPAGGEDSKAKTSIEVYGLQRPGLVRQRKERRLELEPHLEDLVSTLEKFRAKPRDPDLMRDFAKFARRLKPYLDRRKPYTAMARQAVARALASFALRVAQIAR